MATLQALVDDWSFEEQAFSDYVGPLLSLLLQRTLKACRELDSHTQVSVRPVIATDG